MSEVKHTPGPWEAHRTARGDFQIRFGGKGAWLAEVFDDDEPVDGRTEADAHLIAAAPDLWANGCAADTCLSMAYSYARELGRDDEARHINEVQTALRAAIAKSEGRS